MASSVAPESGFVTHDIASRSASPGLGQYLVACGAIDDWQLFIALARQHELRRARLGEILVELGYADAEDIERCLDRASRSASRTRRRIGELLVEAGLIPQTAVEQALFEQRARRERRLGEVLVELGYITRSDLEAALREKANEGDPSSSEAEWQDRSRTLRVAR